MNACQDARTGPRDGPASRLSRAYLGTKASPRTPSYPLSSHRGLHGSKRCVLESYPCALDANRISPGHPGEKALPSGHEAPDAIEIAISH
eukprot:CAMPEP_0180206834 /NCGR_PEP_ID=MMETSP0987-20121128/9770_1 /TAXON_ID=697907 /ORGANISM="non described non described, Strain CCMP2293" /LENGTH=89 /DNA_ID=CAMNT_0022162645 /DNA_START=254 /DNA_END=524 /DNA_ORIENTATION=-